MSAADARSTPDDPLLSVVVTLVDGGSVLATCLDALTRQSDAPPLEILVPYDASVAETAGLRERFPTVTFLELGQVVPERPITSAAGQHELYDRRRARGLAAARGDIVAILEDRGVPRADWARSVVRLHREPHAVIGGAIESSAERTLDWAFYVADFGRYGLPFRSGPVAWISDVNVSYKRRAVDATRESWKERFREPIVHWSLLERGETLYLSSEIVVEHRRAPASLKVLLPERYHWGRLFGQIRAMRMGLGKRVLYFLMGPLVPLLLWVRHGLEQRRKGHLGRYLRASPMLLLLLASWAWGEMWGTLTKRA